MTRLFLYGTLKSGQSNHHRLNGQTFIGNAITTTSYQLFEVACREEPFGPYPALIHLPHPQINTPGLSVMGELWDVTDDCLDMLNQYEDLDSGEYTLEPVTLLNPMDAKTVLTYLYQWPIQNMKNCGPSWPPPGSPGSFPGDQES